MFTLHKNRCILLFSLLSLFLLFQQAHANDNRPVENQLRTQPSPLSEAQQNEIKQLIESGIREKQNEITINERVRSEVNDAFGSNVSWLGTLAGTLSALTSVLTLLPIIVTVLFLIYASSVKSRMLDEINRQAEAQVRERIEKETNAQINSKLKEFEGILSAHSDKVVSRAKIVGEQMEMLTIFEPLLRDVQKKYKTRIDENDKQTVENVESFLNNLKSYPEEYLTFYSFIDMGICSHLLGKYADAIAYYNKAIQKNHPDVKKAYSYKGDAHYRQGEYQESLDSYEEAIKRNQNNYEAWTYKGNALYRLQKFPEAIAAYDKAIEINSNFPDAPFYKARCCVSQNQLEQSLENLRVAIRLNPRCWEEANADKNFDPIKQNPEFIKLKPPTDSTT